MIVVTSAGPGEGKSMFSSNLSVSLAQAGQRVLHIDADMRRPRVHEIFELPQEPGLSNLLVADCKPSEAVRMTAVPSLAAPPSACSTTVSGQHTVLVGDSSRNTPLHATVTLP